MAKELYMYSGINDWSAERLIADLEANMGSKVKIRMNTPGGNPLAGWGMAAKIKEHGKVNIQVDGAANSMGLFLLAYAKKVTALNVSSGVLHRADMYTSTEAEKTWLADRNKDLRAQFSAKIDESKLKALKGVTLEQVFDPEQRINVVLNASEMKQIGLVDEVIELTPIEMEAMDNMLHGIAAETENKKEEKNQKNTTMTLAELKAQFPSVYAEAIAEGAQAEFDRVSAAMVFQHLDAEGVKKIIDSRKPMSMTQMAEFALKAASPAAIAAVAGAATKDVKTDEVKAELDENGKPKTIDPEFAAFEAAVQKDFKLDEKKAKREIVLVR